MPPPGFFYHTPEASEIRRKRSHSEFLRSQSRSQSPWTGRSLQRPEMSSSSAPNFLEPPFHPQAPPLVRYEGDGFDFRRPIMSTGPAGPSNNATVTIDLTDDDSDTSPSFVTSRQLPPLVGANIRRDQPTSAGHPPEPNMADAGGSTNASGSGQNADFTGPSSRRATGEPPRDATIHLEDSDDSDVVFVAEREVTPSHNSRRGGAEAARNQAQWRPMAPPDMPPLRVQSGLGGLGGLGDMIRDHTLNFLQYSPFQRLGLGTAAAPQFAFGLDRHRPPLTVNPPRDPDLEITGNRPVRAPVRQMFPFRMDFEAQAFELFNPATEDEVIHAGPATRGRNESPPYKAPSAPPQGFTRKIEEDTMVVCPNCNEELGSRSHDEIKSQVWVVKACGHVYCGECTRNRFVGKGKSKNQHSSFKKCVVEDCDKPVTSKTAMLQIYL